MNSDNNPELRGLLLECRLLAQQDKCNNRHNRQEQCLLRLNSSNSMMLMEIPSICQWYMMPMEISYRTTLNHLLNSNRCNNNQHNHKHNHKRSQ